jgi:outer membrane protein assembly factor BamB
MPSFKVRQLAGLGLLLGLAGVLGGCETVNDYLGPSEKVTIRGERIRVLNTDKSVEPDAEIAGVEVKLPPAAANADWQQPGGAATNAMQHLAAKGSLVEAWNVSAGEGSSSAARVMASPVIGGGRIYTLDAEANVAAFDADSGAEVWRKSLTPEDRDADKGFGGGVAFDNGRLYVSTGFGFVVALDAATGGEVWKRDGVVPFRMAPVAAGGRVYVATQENQLFALDAATGRPVWDHRGIAESAAILRSNSVATDGNIVIVPYSSGELFALRADNGRVLWSDTLSRGGQLTPLASVSDIAAKPVIDRGFIFAISHSGRFVSIDARTGERVWTIDVGGTQRPWVAGDFVFVVTDDSRVLCVTRATGKIRWSKQLQAFRNEESRRGPINWSGPVLASDRLILVSSEGAAVSLSPFDGSQLGEIAISGGAFVAPIVARETLYVLTDAAGLYAYR